MQVDTHIPPPKKRGKYNHYFEALRQYGNSVLVPYESWNPVEKYKLHTRLGALAYHRKKMGLGTFSTAQEVTGIRIWRIA